MDWQSILAGGLSGIIDSQLGTPYYANDPYYNTAGGVAGQEQSTTSSITSNPWAMAAIAGVIGVVLILALRK